MMTLAILGYMALVGVFGYVCIRKAQARSQAVREARWDRMGRK
jgi:hypothetical protein